MTMTTVCTPDILLRVWCGHKKIHPIKFLFSGKVFPIQIKIIRGVGGNQRPFKLSDSFYQFIRGDFIRPNAFLNKSV